MPAMTNSTRTSTTSMPYVRAMPAHTPPSTRCDRSRRNRWKRRDRLPGGGGGGGGGGGAGASGGAGGVLSFIYAVCATGSAGTIGIVPEPIPDGLGAGGRDHRFVRRTSKPLSRREFVRPVEGRMVAGVAV